MASFRELVNDHVLQNIDDLARTFRSAEPFEHIIIDDFFRAEYLEQLIGEFPDIERRGRRTKEHLREIAPLGPAYETLDATIQSDEFLRAISDITGIEHLLYDPAYQGGGVHRNFEGYRHMSHIDYNYHNNTRWHRRLNLIVYITPGWKDDWGGALFLYEDGSKPRLSKKIRVPCLYNRAILFATHLHSWHGVETISFPEGTKPVTRDSIALYFFTEERPAEQITDRYQTQFFPRELPEFLYKPGLLDKNQIQQLDQYQDMVSKLVGTMYNREQAWLKEIDELRSKRNSLKKKASRFLNKQIPSLWKSGR